MKSDKVLIFSLIFTCFLCGCATATKPMLGSWGQTIKDNSTWGSDDVESTVDALVGTGQNFHIYPINSENEWIDFLALLEVLKSKEISEKDLKIFAVMPSPHLFHSDSIWFGSSGPPTNSCSGHDQSKRDCDRSYIENWLNAWESAAMELSELSNCYENLTGFVINDFMNYVESADLPSEVYGDRLKKSDIDRLHAAARLHNCEFEFWPAIHYMDIGRFIADSHILGINYGAKLSDLDQMSAKLYVNIPYQPAWGILRFYHAATGEEQYIEKSVLVNGGSVWSEELTGSHYTQAFEELIELNRGTNTIEFVFSSDPSNPGSHTSSGGTNKFWYIWDVRIETVTPPPDMSKHMIDHWRKNLLGGFQVPISSIEYAVNTDPDKYTPVNGGADHSGGTEIYNSDYRAFGTSAGLPDNSLDGFAAKRLVAAPSDIYSIKDSVDGFIPYLGRTDNFDTDLSDPDDAYIVTRSSTAVDEPYRALLASTSEILGDTKLMAIHTAFSGSGSYEVNPEILLKRTSIASEEADATGIYLFPHGLYFMDPSDRRGIFAESTFSHPCLTSEPDAQFMVQWPQGQPRLPGWYQRWYYPATTGGSSNLRVTVGDSRTAGSAWSGNLYKSIYSVSSTGTTDHYSADIYQDDTSAQDVPAAPNYIWSDTHSPLSLKMYSKGASNLNTCVYFKVQDDAGNYVDKSDFTFESGLDLPDGANPFEIYHLHKRFFQSFP